MSTSNQTSGIKDSQVKQNQTVVVLGVGPAGLACAYKMLRHKLYERVVVIDKAKMPGGAGASFTWKDHTLDFGPHAFHRRGDEPEQLIRDLFKDDPNILIEGRKNVRVFLRGKFFKYPLQVKEVLLKFNPLLSFKILCEFAATIVLHRLVSIPVTSFEDWGRKRFGPTLYRLGFGDYTKKVWKTDSTAISNKFASEKIQGFSFINLIKRLLRVGGQVTEPYYQTWLYHRNGSGALYSALADKIKQLGGEVLLESDIKKITVQNNKASHVYYQRNGEMHELSTDVVVNTIQLPAFIRLVGNEIPFFVKYHANKLRYISLVLVFIEFNVEFIGNDTWFYLLDPKFVFNRVTEQKNLSESTMGKGKTVLSFELTCRKDDTCWNMPDEALFKLAVADCQHIPHLAKNLAQVTGYTIKRAPHVYEIYQQQFDAHAEIALSYINDIENVVTIGRRGLFLQGDMHQSVEMGLKMGNLIKEYESDMSRAKSIFIKDYVRYIN